MHEEARCEKKQRHRPDRQHKLSDIATLKFRQERETAAHILRRRPSRRGAGRIAEAALNSEVDPRSKGRCLRAHAALLRGRIRIRSVVRTALSVRARRCCGSARRAKSGNRSPLDARRSCGRPRRASRLRLGWENDQLNRERPRRSKSTRSYSSTRVYYPGVDPPNVLPYRCDCPLTDRGGRSNCSWRSML